MSKSDAIGEATHAYIGRKACGCIVAAVLDTPGYPKRAAKEVAKFIRDGLTVERVENSVVRAEFGCKHNKKPVANHDQLKLEI